MLGDILFRALKLSYFEKVGRNASKMTSLSKFDKKLFEKTMKTRFFFGPSFHIYGGGMSGFYDFGPLGCALKTNLLALWRSHFILEENMMEVDCPMLTPAPVLKASGHVDKFSDFMVQDGLTKEYFRADHLLANKISSLLNNKKNSEAQKMALEKSLALVDAWSNDPVLLEEKLKEYEVKSPETGNDLSPPIPFNLMFPTFIGPTGLAKGYLRPETAQGIFVNFKRLLEYNQNKLPFACAQIGTSFRNEISPRQGLLRLREFQMAEVEHFLHPKDKSHPRFAQVSHVELHLLPREAQELAKEAEIRTIGEAVRSGMINSETLGYYIARTYLFLLRAGIKPDKVRFRQHLATEMAHYACDCWDAELLLASGWIECVGCADRSAYDLQRHSEFSDQQLMATERLDQPLRREVMFVLPNKALLGPLLGKRMTAVQKCLDELTVESKMAMQRQLVEQGTFVLSVAGEELELRPEMVSFKTEEQNVYDEHFTPHVIEPSFGISRLVYAILEQNFYLRDGDEPRAVLSFPPVIAPVAVTIFPLLNNKGFVVFIEKLSKEFRQAEVLFKVDDSNVNIGRRYVRADETGCAFGCTIDFDTLKDDTVTLRERDSMGQARLPISDVAAVVKALVQQKCTWEQLIKKYGLFVFAGDSR